LGIIKDSFFVGNKQERIFYNNFLKKNYSRKNIGKHFLPL
jgi:hypothetical protein